MSNARVQSIDAIQRFAEQLQAFRLAMAKEIEALDLELRRVSSWVHEDAQDYWHREHQNNARKLAEHLQQLSRCMSYVRADEQRPCTEEKKRVARAKERAQLCETKIRLGKAASLHWESRSAKVTSKIQRCQDLVEADLLIAVNHLRKHLELLDSYTRLRSDGLGRTGPTGTKSNSSENLGIENIAVETPEAVVPVEPVPEEPDPSHQTRQLIFESPSETDKDLQ